MIIPNHITIAAMSREVEDIIMVDTKEFSYNQVILLGLIKFRFHLT